MEKPEENTIKSITPYAILIWSLAALFYAYELFLRISPNVMATDLIRDFGATATSIGFLASLYYYPYAFLQIPVGMILDKMGVRYTLTAAAAIVSLGCLLFAGTHELSVAGVGRVLMGLGSAFAFVGCLKLSANWFPSRYFGLVVGLTNTVGIAIGALGGFEPLGLLVDHVGWRNTFFIAMVLGIGLTFLLLITLRDKPNYMENYLQCANKEESPPLWESLLSILTSKQSWLIALYGGLMVVPIIAFGELWSGTFISGVHHIDKNAAAGLSSLLFVGIAVGGPLHGLVSGWLGRRRPVMLVGVLGALISFSLIIYGPFHSQMALGILLFIMGFFTVSMLLCFAINSEIHSSAITGIVIGFTNMVVVMLGSFIFQPLIGKILDLQWTGVMSNGIPVYTMAQYRWALSVLPLCQVLALFCVLNIRETRCKHVVTE